MITSNRYGYASSRMESTSTDKYSELQKFLDTSHKTNTHINKEGFFGKLNKYQYADLKKLKEEPLNQHNFGKPTTHNNASMRQLVNY